jgi:hypothetical protein
MEKKSLNKMWREVGKPMPFKDFAEKYNNRLSVVYKSATGVDSTASISVSAPTVNTRYGNYLAIGILLTVSLGLVYSLSKKQ